MAFFRPTAGVCVAIVFALASASIGADSINPTTVQQSSPSMTGVEKMQRDFVLAFYQVMMRGRHVELASMFFGTYTQHNPNIPTGPDGIMFGPRQQPPLSPIPPLNPPPVVTAAKGDFAWVVWEREEKDPRDPSKTDHYNFFDIFRIENARLEEHWDSGVLNAANPQARRPGPYAPPAARVVGSRGRLSAEEKKNLELANAKIKGMVQDGDLKLAEKVIAPDYIEHDPNIGQGRAALLSAGGGTPQQRETQKNAPSLTLVSGPYVLMMWDVKAPDPFNPGKEYTYSHFDMTRVEQGLIKEHWNDLRVNR
jgi:predicted SnoaL-like aldol condensation-catalyzing enzyme